MSDWPNNDFACDRDQPSLQLQMARVTFAVLDNFKQAS